MYNPNAKVVKKNKVVLIGCRSFDIFCIFVSKIIVKRITKRL